ncbi:MAG TPA: M14 metallopeptidase family protein [Vicinamibacteria bacterium]|nr:M14 metallopeptidase family protein [Vicinamibacteria bacterium]
MWPALVLSLAGALSPSELLGKRIGDDRVLADWNEAVRYLEALDAASDRVRVERVGRTTEGRPFLVVTITSPENFARLEAIRRDNLRLYDPRGLPQAEVEEVLDRGRTIVALHHGIHATEVAASQTALETAHWLATAEDEATRAILRESVILMLPSHNPDGMQLVSEWYARTLGTPFEGEEPPFLYHHYTGHDNNRDWYMFTQDESRLTVEHVYDRWRPQIVHDLHQMSSKAARIFLPPYVDPWEPNVDPALVGATNALGMHVAAALLSQGRTGVVTQAIYDAWSPSRAYPFSHGGIRLLSECASAKLATPIEMPLQSLQSGIGYDPRRASWNFPAPWPGGRWRVRDIMDYQLAATRAVLEHAAGHRGFWLRNFLEVNRRAVARRDPYAFVIPAEARDPYAAAKLLDVLRRGGVELHRAAAGFSAAGRDFAAGSWVVSLQQPASAFAKMLLETQRYPELRPHPRAPMQKPYDATAHTLPLLLGVPAIPVSEPFEASLERVAEPRVAGGRVEGRGRAFAIGHGTGELVAAVRLLREGVALRWAQSAFTDRGAAFPAGTLLVPASARERLAALARETGLRARAVDAAPRALRLRLPRVGLYRSYGPSMDEGWTRYVLERDLALPYTTLGSADISDDLEKRYDAIVLPDEPPRTIVEGRAPGTLPEEFTGGIGEDGVRALRGFVERGGTLVALNNASLLPVEDFDLGVENALPKPGEGEEPTVLAPGSILRAAVARPEHPLAHGLDGSSIVWFEDSPAFEATRGTAILRYDEEAPLLSGYLAGGERLRGLSPLVEAPLGRGRVVLFGFRPQYRAQSWATYVLFLNALLLAGATPGGL